MHDEARPLAGLAFSVGGVLLSVAEALIPGLDPHLAPPGTQRQAAPAHTQSTQAVGWGLGSGVWSLG